MSDHSSIEWTQWTWNPVVGCTRVTDGCSACYAFALHDRRHTIYVANGGLWRPGGEPMPRQYALSFSKVQLLPERLEQPLRVRQSRLVFVNSVSDLFHSQVPDDYIRRVFDVMRRAHWHIFQILTKRAGRLRRLGPLLDWPSNVWMGVSIENDALTVRADALREVPAAVRFLSCEPLLGPLSSLDLSGIHWVIGGGESGPQARPMRKEWAAGLREHCLGAGVPFFMKQMGTVWAREHHSSNQKGGDWNDWPEALRVRDYPDALKGTTLYAPSS
jgi:protein gp37